MVAVLVFMVAPAALAEEVAGLPLHVTRLAPNVIRVWVGDHISSTAVVAFATSKGIVVVDTIGIPKVDTELRGIIARELGRRDFKLLINTHEHGDHTGGNGVYADCTIVAHELVGPALTRPVGDNQRFVEWVNRRIDESESRLASLDVASVEARKLRETIILDRLNLEVRTSGTKPVLPSKTFSDRLTLDMGDTTFDLFFIGGLHSSSDIAIHVPQHGILLTGDTMADKWLNETPGCLAAFSARDGVVHNFPLWLSNWELILAQKDRIKLLLPGHWNGELSLAGAQARVDYIRTLWNGIHKAVQAGKGMSDVYAEYRLDTRFPSLAQSPGFSAREHGSTIAEMWKIAANQESAAVKLHALIDEGAPEAAIQEVLAEREKKQSKYFFVEGEINGHGYRFLGEDKVDKAIAMFKLNVKLYPQSWNVYDSLGEALARRGDTAKAVQMYEKSLALNPESPSGKEALAKLKAAESGV
jgi:glyoxylase-like metal-dependent hydrolase (beta-lactamase superfamily II)